MKTLRRAWLFARDYWSEFGIAWSLARMNDCERNGGHRWGASSYDATMRAYGSTCSRCGCWQASAIQPIIPTTNGTSATYTLTIHGSSS